MEEFREDIKDFYEILKIINLILLVSFNDILCLLLSSMDIFLSVLQICVFLATRVPG